ncbi:MAG TPA: acyl-CoA dehydrogenase family protein [Acidimicrobiales bacterium]
MDLDLSDDQQLLRDTSARFIEDRCPLPHVRELAASADGVDPTYGRQAADLGWYSLLVDEEHGGGSVSGKSFADAAIVALERGRYLQPGAFVPGNVVAWALAHYGNDEQQAKVLPAVIAGERVATWAAADSSGSWEPGAGATVEPTGSGLRLAGAKGLVQDAHLAEWLLVTAASPTGLTQLLVPAGAPGVEIVRLDGLDITRRFCTVRFSGVELTPADVVGELGGAAAGIDREMQVAAVLTLAESIGAMDQDFTVALDYAKVRTAFGRPIGSFQAMKHMLADTSLLLESSKAIVTAAIEALDEEAENAAEVVSMAKAYVGDSAIELAQNCFQTFGGIGFTWEHDQHLYLRRLTADSSLYGEPAWHRERIWQLYGL